MPRNKPTKEELIKIAKLGGSDKDLYLLNKIKEIVDDIEEIDGVIDENDEELRRLSRAMDLLSSHMEEAIKMTTTEMTSKIDDLRKEMSNLIVGTVGPRLSLQNDMALLKFDKKGQTYSDETTLADQIDEKINDKKSK